MLTIIVNYIYEKQPQILISRWISMENANSESKTRSISSIMSLIRYFQEANLKLFIKSHVLITWNKALNMKNILFSLWLQLIIFHCNLEEQ